MKENVGWYWKKIFMERFRPMLHGSFPFFSGVLNWILIILVWFKRSLHSAQGSGQSCPWPLKLMTSHAVERTWIRTGGYGRPMGEWVNLSIKEEWSKCKLSFGQAMYRSLKRAPQDIRDGFHFYSAQAAFAWPSVDLGLVSRKSR